MTSLPKPIEANTLLPLANDVALCVDLDGSLIKSDTLWEGVWLAFREHPLKCFLTFVTLVWNRAAFKRSIAQLAIASPSQLPYRQDLLRFLSAQAQSGRRLMLATAADELVALGVAQYLGIFDDVVSSDGSVNRSGRHKLEAIKRLTGRFVYVGDSTADLPIWRGSLGAIVVGRNRTIPKRLREAGVTIYGHFSTEPSRLSSVIRCLRVNQWLKNLLVFMPIVLGHKILEPRVWLSGTLAFLAFCFAASTGYVLNDLLDLQADRQHPEKSKRPLAAGDLSIPNAFLLFAAAVFCCLTVSSLLTVPARLCVLIYFGCTIFYSSYLKKRLMVDVVALALLYSLRVIAGGAATGIVISMWTIGFCLFFFYSLALVKRFGELRALPENREMPVRRGYRRADLPVLVSAGVSSGILSVVVLALYISGSDVRAEYRTPAVLWLACPVLLYWFGRIWLLANRGDIAEDPLLFSLKDKVGYVALLCVALIWLAASIAW